MDESRGPDPLVTVVVPCFNSEAFVADAVKSILRQSRQDLECLIVDDGSTDSTRSCAQALCELDARVRYVHQPNGGVASARNCGVRNARGVWVQHLDVDDRLHPDKLRLQLEGIEDPWAEQELVLFSDYDVVRVDDSGREASRDRVTVGPLSGEELYARMLEWNCEPDVALHVNSSLINREVFKSTVWNARYPACSDLDFFTRVLHRGTRFRYTPIVGMDYVIHGNNWSLDTHRLDEGYLMYLEDTATYDPSAVKRSKVLSRIVFNAIRSRERDRIERSLALNRDYEVPLCFGSNRANLASAPLLRLLYELNIPPPTDHERPTALFWVRRLGGRVKRGLSRKGCETSQT